MTTVTGLFDDYQDASDAVGELAAIGVPRDDISIVANNSDSWYGSDKKVDRDRGDVHSISDYSDITARRGNGR